MNEAVKELVRLVQENPDAEVICMTDTDVVGDGSFGSYLSEIHCCRIGEYVCYSERVYDDREEFKEDYYDANSDELCEKFHYSPLLDTSRLPEFEVEHHKRAEQDLENYLDSLAEKYFRKAIICHITTPTNTDVVDVPRFLLNL